MKKSYPKFLCLLILWLPLQLFSQETQQVWYGKLQITGTSIPLELHVEDAKAGLVKMYSPSQSKQGFPVEKWRWKNDEMSWEISKIKVKYVGKWNADSAFIQGDFTQNGNTLPLRWKKTEEVTALPKMELNRPQTPQPPFDYNMEEFTFTSDDHGRSIQMSGTLVMPNGNGPFPCLVMISGSGPQNRDEEIAGHKPFAVIADDLAKMGWASFRYDDRGVGKSEGEFSKATTFDFAIDANAAWKMITANPKIDAKKIGLLGHSEGGLVAPIVASQNKEVYCIVSLAGPGVTGSQVILQQIEDIAKAEGQQESEMIESLNAANSVMTFVTNEKDSTAAAAVIHRYIFKSNKKKSKSEREELFATYNRSFNNEWMKVFLKTDPIPYWQKVQCPTLILNGEKDLQVRFDQNANRIAETLKMSKIPYEKVILADNNHLFQYTQTGKVSEYAKLEETISPEALQSIREWLIKLP